MKYNYHNTRVVFWAVGSGELAGFSKTCINPNMFQNLVLYFPCTVTHKELSAGIQQSDKRLGEKNTVNKSEFNSHKP